MNYDLEIFLTDKFSIFKYNNKIEFYKIKVYKIEVNFYIKLKYTISGKKS